MPEIFELTKAGEFITQQNVWLLAPELLLSVVILAIVMNLALSKSDHDREQFAWFTAVFGCILAFANLIGLSYVQPNSSVFFNMFEADAFSGMIRGLLLIGTLFVLLISRDYIKAATRVPGEFYAVLMTALLGGMLMSGATDLIMLFVALETLGISSYLMVGFLRNSTHSAEAGLKYLIYGGVATAMMMYGFSMLYGLSGSTNFAQIADALGKVDLNYPLMAITSVLLVSGFAFKLSAAPFHMWTPDVYDGAPTPVTAFLSVVSKIAGFAVVIRFIYVLMGDISIWFGLIAAIASLSMVIGNVGALVQTSMKRMLAYSTIGHAGYMLVGLTVLTPQSLGSLVYYLIAYLFMNIGAFAAIIQFSNQTGRDDIAAFSGLVQKRFYYTVVLSVMMLSLGGIPITAGFFGKFFLFQAVASASSAHLWLIAVALLTSTISLFYYLNVIRVMVVEEPSDVVAALSSEENEVSLTGLSMANLVLTFCLFGTLILGVMAEPAVRLTTVAVEQLKNPYAFAQEYGTDKQAKKLVSVSEQKPSS